MCQPLAKIRQYLPNTEGSGLSPQLVIPAKAGIQ